MINNIRYFFRFTIPDEIDKVKYWFKHGNRVFVMMTIALIAFSPIFIYQTVMSYEFTKAQDQSTKTKKNTSDSETLGEGPRKYLRDVFQVSSDAKVQEIFDANEKYHGQYSNVIKQSTQYKKADALRKYLEPIIDELRDGKTKSAAKISHSFTLDKSVNLSTPVSDSELQSGVMFVLWNSKAKTAQEDAKKIDEIVSKSDYTVKVYDKASINGTTNFDVTLGDFLNMGNTIRPGFDSSNSWSGIVYGFKNGLFVYHSKTIDNVPTVMPTKTLADSSIKQSKAPTSDEMYNN